MGSKLIGALVLSLLTACASQPRVYTYGGKPLTFEQRMAYERHRSQSLQQSLDSLTQNSERAKCSMGVDCRPQQPQQVPQQHRVNVFHY
jgi:hypothetical protein